MDGSVQFKDGDTVLGTSDAVTLNGLAVLQVNRASAPGVHAITAHCSGSTNFLPVSSSPFTLTVQPIAASTFTLLIPLTNPRLAGQPAVFAALVVPFGGGTPTGTVRFTEGNTTLGNVPLTGGVALFSTTALATGLHGISASYLGAGDACRQRLLFKCRRFIPARRPTSTAVTLASSPNPSTLDQPVTFTATVTGGATTR